MENLDFDTVGVCSICGSRDSSQVEVASAYGHRLEYRSCTGCGLVRLDPRPTSRAIRHFYETFYMDPAGRNVEATRIKQRDFARYMLSVMSAHVRLDRVRSVLDIGCGYGETLAVVGQAVSLYGESSLFGIEPSTEAREYAKTICTLVGSGTEDLVGIDKQYDLIIMAHVLEHMDNPVATLELISSKLASGGYLSLEVPNYFCHQSTDIAHFYLFTPQSLSNTFAQAGLELVALYESDHATSTRPAYLTAIARVGRAANMQLMSPAEVLRRRSEAIDKWPGYTKPRRIRQFARKVVSYIRG